MHITHLQEEFYYGVMTAAVRGNTFFAGIESDPCGFALNIVIYLFKSCLFLLGR